MTASLSGGISATGRQINGGGKRFVLPAPAVSNADRSRKEEAIGGCGISRTCIHGIRLIYWHPSLLATALSARFIGNAWGSRGEEVSPASTTYCADILFNGYSFWWRLFYSLPCRSTKFWKEKVMWNFQIHHHGLYHPPSGHVQIFVAILFRVFAIYEGDWPLTRRSKWLAIYSQGIRFRWGLDHLTLVSLRLWAFYASSFLSSSDHLLTFDAILLKVFAIYEGDWSLARRRSCVARHSQSKEIRFQG